MILFNSHIDHTILEGNIFFFISCYNLYLTQEINFFKVALVQTVLSSDLFFTDSLNQYRSFSKSNHLLHYFADLLHEA